MTDSVTDSIGVADAYRVIVHLARPRTPKVDRERIVRGLLLRLDGPDPRRVRLLRDAAANARHDIDQLRRYRAARDLILGHQPDGSHA